MHKVRIPVDSEKKIFDYDGDAREFHLSLFSVPCLSLRCILIWMNPQRSMQIMQNENIRLTVQLIRPHDAL